MNTSLIKICQDLYKIPRSLTGIGVRETLQYLQKIIPIKIKEVNYIKTNKTYEEIQRIEKGGNLRENECWNYHRDSYKKRGCSLQPGTHARWQTPECLLNGIRCC